MKKYIAILVLLSPILAFASENCSTTVGTETVEETKEIKTDVPNYLKGAMIIVRTADGRESSVPAEQFKVVPRKQQFLVSRIKQTDKTMCSAETNKNRVSLLAGNGAKGGLSRSSTPTSVTIESRTGVIGGAQYQRLLTDRISVGAQIQDNKSVLMNIGLDF